MDERDSGILHEDHEDSLNKRRRNGRACEQCRKKKIRCDGGKESAPW